MSSSDSRLETIEPADADMGGVDAGRVESNAIEVVNGKTVFKPTREFFLAFSALMVISLAIAFDATSLSVALPIISSTLGGTALEAFWSGTSFLLASTVLQPTVAGLSHIFGRKYVSISLFIFTPFTPSSQHGLV